MLCYIKNIGIHINQISESLLYNYFWDIYESNYFHSNLVLHLFTAPINIHWWSKDSKTFKVGYFFTEGK